MGVLKEYIKAIIKEDWHPKKNEFSLGSGAIAEIGSYGHLAELEKILDDLIKLRDMQSRSSASRFAYASAISRLKQQIRKIEKRLENRQNVRFK